MFNYDEAFQRNLGFIDRDEQHRLRDARVAIAGLGGTGGAQCHSLARMGIGRFHLADLDTFELANFNRQMGAALSTLGQSKAVVARRAIEDINAEASVTLFERGIQPDTVAAFLDGVDIVVDSLDFYCFEERFLLYAAARERGLWVITAPPLGFGFSLLAFDPCGMSFEDYFDFRPGMAIPELAAHLICGIAPGLQFFRYLQGDGINVQGHRLPSLGAAPFMVAGVVASEVCKHLLGRGRRLVIPRLLQFDAWRLSYQCRTRSRGMRGWASRLTIRRIQRLIEQQQGV